MSNDNKVKVRVFRLPNRKVPFADIVQRYDNNHTLKTVRQSMTMLSEILGTNHDTFYLDETLRCADKICKAIELRYNGSSTYLKHIKTIKGFITKAKEILDLPLTGDECPFTDIARPHISVPPKITNDYSSWTTVIVPYLDDVIANGKLQGKIFALFYRSGYIFRPGMLFDAKTVDDGVSNYYDKYLGLFKIIHQKNKQKMSVQVDEATRKALFTLVGNTWVLEKTKAHNGSRQYTSPNSRTMGSVGLNKYTADQFRESFTTWLYDESGYPESKISEWNAILGHSDGTARTFYYKGKAKQSTSEESTVDIVDDQYDGSVSTIDSSVMSY